MTRPRRSRFTVTCSPPHSNAIVKNVILAYSETGASSYYTDRGFTVLAVMAGDYRHQGGGFRLDRANLREAIEFLGLKLPVKVRYNARQGGSYGNYRMNFKGGGAYHDIMVKSYLSPQQAGETLWHELAHAMQAERATEGVDGNAWDLREALMGFYAESHGVGYMNKPHEIEARSYEAHNNELPLAK